MTPTPSVKKKAPDDQFGAWVNSLTAPTREVAYRLVVDNKLSAENVTMGWFALEVVGDEHPRLVKFATYAAQIDHAKQLAKQEGVRLFLWWGAPVRLTTGPFKFAVHPSGERTPLFDMPDPQEMEFDDSGQFTDDSAEAIGEVTELNLGGQTIPLSVSGGDTEPEDVFDETADFDEYEEVETEQEFEDEEDE